MKDFSSNLIQHKAGLIEAMQKLGEVPGNLTLFVVDPRGRLLGTLTDGDIRRGLIAGLNLEDTVDKFMFKSFHHVNKGFSLQDFKAARDKGVRLLPLLSEQGCIEKIYDLKKRRSMLPLEAVIMAGGRGERLRPLTDSTPKPLLPLGNKPIIEHNIDRLISFGIETIHISLGYLGQQLVDYLGDGSQKGIQIRYIRENQPLGTAGALSLAEKFSTEYILLMNSDLFTDADFEDLYLSTLQQKACLGVASVPYSTKVPYGIFSTRDQYITGLTEKPLYTHYANAGIYVLNQTVLHYIPRGRSYHMTDLIDRLLAEKQSLIHNPIIGYWIDIGQYQDYTNAREIVKHLSHD